MNKDFVLDHSHSLYLQSINLYCTFRQINKQVHPMSNAVDYWHASLLAHWLPIKYIHIDLVFAETAPAATSPERAPSTTDIGLFWRSHFASSHSHGNCEATTALASSNVRIDAHSTSPSHTRELIIFLIWAHFLITIVFMYVSDGALTVVLVCIGV